MLLICLEYVALDRGCLPVSQDDLRLLSKNQACSLMDLQAEPESGSFLAPDLKTGPNCVEAMTAQPTLWLMHVLFVWTSRALPRNCMHT